MEHPLDNPVWSSLASTQAHLAIDCGVYKRYPPRIGPFCAVQDRNALVEDPSGLCGGAYFVGEIPAFSDRCKVTATSGVFQMVFEGDVPPQPGDEVELLTEADAPAMLGLVESVLPGFFRPETWRLGRYTAIRRDGRIAAMSGERFALTGWREVSAVCTHPDFLGRGYGARMTLLATQWIVAQGLRPFLHVSVTNARAIEVYKRVGFVVRTELPVVFVS